MAGRVTAQLLDDSRASSFVGNGTSKLYLWGAQFESQGRMSSYIPTTTAAGNRKPDGAVLRDITSFYNPSQGTLAIELVSANDDAQDAINFSSAARLCAVTCGTDNFELQTFRNYTVASVLAANTNSYNRGFTTTPFQANSSILKTSLSYDEGASPPGSSYFQSASNGILATSGGGTPLPSGVDRLNFAAGQVWYRKFYYWNTRLTPARIRALTE
ncbi:MAG: hypothetical protein EOP06_31900 [Proteobacteria bacterium]|nr:MAG: hypothetical protein EOP06_31900 [Pseudomonadota bacterium]